MNRIIISNLRQSIFTWRFLLCVIFMAAAVFLSSTEAILNAFRSENPLTQGFHEIFILNAVRSDAIIFCLPIVCTLPFAASYVDDVKTGFLKLYIHRISRHGYIFGKVLGSMISGGIAVAAGLLLAYGIATIIFLPMEALPVSGIRTPAYFGEICSSCGMFFLSGGLWSLFGMTMSVLMESKYIAYASPFVIYYCLIILHERYFDWLYLLYPKAWVSPGEEWVIGKWGAVLLLLGLILIEILCFDLAVKRRVSVI